MKALVTGANGLIGWHLVKALLGEGHEVRALTRATSDRAHLEDLDVEIIDADVLVADDVEDAPRGCDVVFHTAVPFAYEGQVDDDIARTAIEGTANVLRASSTHGARRVVVTSSSVVFGHSSTPEVIDEQRPLATAVDLEPGYVRAKLRQDLETARLAEQLGLDVVIACPTMTVGPEATRLGPSNAIVVQYLLDPFSSTFDGGINVVAAGDVAAGHLRIASAGQAGERYLLGGDNLTWRSVHSTIAELCGVAPPRLTVSPTMAYLGATAEEARARLRRRAPLATREQASMTGRYYWYSSAKANALGFRSRPARDALATAISWLVASPHVSREMRTSMVLHRDVYAAREQMATNPTRSQEPA